MLNARTSPTVVGSYIVGAISGAALSVAILTVLAGLLSPLPLGTRAVALLLGVVALMARSTGRIAFRLPQNSRQIPQEAFRVRPSRAAFRFAFELGTSVRTYVTSESPYAAALLIALVLPADAIGALTHAGAAAVGFGIGRAWIVGTQVFRTAMIVEHPRWALRVGNTLALASSAWLGISAL